MKYSKFLKGLGWITGLVVLVFLAYFFLGKPPQPSQITWGVNFSQKEAQLLDLDWEKTYLDILDDLEPSEVKLVAYWDLIEPQRDQYHFSDLDFQIQEAQKREVKILLVMGEKVPRWPECHYPSWVEDLDSEQRQEELLELLEKIVSRYQSQSTIWAWQVENEPLFSFGECPPLNEEFLKEEIDLVKSLDSRPVVFSASGTKFWFEPAKLGDIVSVSLYRVAWFKEINTYIHYPFTPVFYWRKVQLIDRFFGKEVFCGELQAEPWGPVPVYELGIEEQKKTMNLNQFRRNINFAQQTGLSRFYLWGVEWWYWLKQEQNQPQIWNEARQLLSS